MKKVLFCKQEVGTRGGLEKYSERLLKAFAQKGCDVTLATASANVGYEGIKSVHLPVSGVFGFQRLKQWEDLTKVYSKTHPHDIVFTLDRITYGTHIRVGNGVHASYLQKRNESFLRHLSFKINPLHKTILRLEAESFLSKNIRKIIVNSHMVKEEIISYYDVDPLKIAVHHNGVEYEEMASNFGDWQQTRLEMQQELRLTPGLFTFLFVGHHYKRKGLDQLLQGFAKIDDAQLLVVGKEKHLERYRVLVKTLGLSGRVHFLGPHTAMHRLYATADALVIPSLYDPFANVTIEALAMGLFVVTSAFNGGKEILEESSGCIIENLFDANSVATSLEKAMRFPKNVESALAIRAKTSSFDFAKKLPQLIESCLRD